MDIVRKAADRGWIEVVTGSMFSGKSEELIRRLRRAQIARQKVQIFKPVIDNRYGDSHITSHSAMRIESETVASSRELLEHVRHDTEVVGIDEGQFFDAELPAVVNTLADQGRRVIVAGLDQDPLPEVRLGGGECDSAVLLQVLALVEIECNLDSGARDDGLVQYPGGAFVLLDRAGHRLDHVGDLFAVPDDAQIP